MEQLRPLSEQVEAQLKASLQHAVDVDGTRPPAQLGEAMEYALLAGGKRLRPLMVLLAAHATGGDDVDERAWPAAMAVEYVHTYSLIHDDLPALDDDDLRRGRPTVHKAYNEATAILAGDGLLTDAFAFVATAPVNAAAQCHELALAGGSCGMVGGQMLDMLAEGRPADEVDLVAIHALKTGRLFIGSCALGGLAVGASDEQVKQLRTFGAEFGLAFQIADDVLDVIGDESKRGKVSGGDADADKATYVRRFGLEGAKARATQAAERAVAALAPFDERADRLRALARFAADRTI